MYAHVAAFSKKSWKSYWFFYKDTPEMTTPPLIS